MSKKKTVTLLLIVIVLCIRMLYLFSLRTSHFIDELYSMGFANSNELAFFSPSIDENGNEYMRHYRDWCEGKELRDYITVSYDERFDFLNVIENKMQDTAPANYEIMVHFVCSLFPNTFSWAYPFAVNYIFYFFTLILVILISRDLINDVKIKFINCLFCLIFFGFSIGGTGAFTFLRMYGVLSFYGLLMIYAFCKLQLYEDFKHNFVYGGILFFATFFGLATHTLFVTFAFWLTLFVCVYRLFSGKVFVAIKEGGLVLCSLLLFVFIYPFPYDRIDGWMNHENANGFSYFTKLIVSNRHMFAESIGFYIPFTYANIMSWIGTALIVVIVIFGFTFVFRKEKWFASVILKVGCLVKNTIALFNNSLKKLNPMVYIMFITALAYMLTVTAIAPVNTQKYSTRYFMLGMFPLIISFVSFTLSLFSSFSSKIKKYTISICAFVLSVLLLVQNFVYHNPFYFNKPYDKEDELHQLVYGEDVMVIGEEMNRFYNLIASLRDCKTFYYSLYTEDFNEIGSLPQNEFYIMITRDIFIDEDPRLPLVNGVNLTGVDHEGSTMEYVNRLLAEKKYECEIEFVRCYYVFGGDYAIYRISPVQLN